MCICVYEDCVGRINSLALWQFHYSSNEIRVLCQWHGFFKETKCEAKRICWIPKTQFWIGQSNFLLVGIKLNKFTLVFSFFFFPSFYLFIKPSFCLSSILVLSLSLLILLFFSFSFCFLHCSLFKKKSSASSFFLFLSFSSFHFLLYFLLHLCLLHYFFSFSPFPSFHSFTLLSQFPMSVSSSYFYTSASLFAIFSLFNFF